MLACWADGPRREGRGRGRGRDKGKGKGKGGNGKDEALRMSASVSVDYRHLAVHQYDVGLCLLSGVRVTDMLETFHAVPDGHYWEPEHSHKLDGNLLVDST
jgi:hypothetical protein